MNEKILSPILSPLQQRLSEPTREISIEELAATWFSQIVEISISGYAHLIENENLLPLIRRAWGSELVKSASSETIDEKPCTWTPPCALDVFFREQMRVGRHGLPKPYVLAADKKGQDLIIKLSVFGFASEWLPAAIEHLVRALREVVSWKKLAGKSFLQKFEIKRVRTGTIEGFAMFEEAKKIPSALDLIFITPADATGKHNILDEPHSLIGRLARRIDGLARWQDAKIIANWKELSETWKSLEYWSGELTPDITKRYSQRQKSNLVNEAVSGLLSISGDFTPILPLLIIGQNCHVGRGAVSGQGRYNVNLIE